MIQLKLENTHLVVLNNDPKRTRYERKYLGYDVDGTRVSLTYKGSEIAKLTSATLDEAGSPFGSLNALILFLSENTATEAIGGGSGGSSNLTPADITSAINNSQIRIATDAVDLTNSQIVVNTQDIENLITITNSTMDSITNQLSMISNGNPRLTKPTTGKQITSNQVAGVVITSPATATPTSLYLVNLQQVAAHWVVFLPPSNTAVGTTNVLAFYNPGTAGFQLLIDANTLGQVDMNGFVIARSSSPTQYNPLASNLANAAVIQVTWRGV